MELIDALRGLRPKAHWYLVGDKYEGLTWLDKDQTKPSEDEVNSYITGNAYVELRKNEYPSVTDQLDAIMKGGQDFSDMQAICLAIKAKYPKG